MRVTRASQWPSGPRRRRSCWCPSAWYRRGWRAVSQTALGSSKGSWSARSRRRRCRGRGERPRAGGVIPVADLLVDVLDELGRRDRVCAVLVVAGTAPVLAVHEPGPGAGECLGGVLAYHRRAQFDVGARGHLRVGGGCGPGHDPRVPSTEHNRHAPRDSPDSCPPNKRTYKMWVIPRSITH